jgi:uncharacterized membrane protein
MYIALGIIGFVLLFAAEMVISPDTKNASLKMIYDNRLIIGIVSVVLAYYFYTLEAPTEMSSPLLPSYDEATTVSSQG